MTQIMTNGSTITMGMYAFNLDPQTAAYKDVIANILRALEETLSYSQAERLVQEAQDAVRNGTSVREAILNAAVKGMKLAGLSTFEAVASLAEDRGMQVPPVIAGMIRAAYAANTTTVDTVEDEDEEDGYDDTDSYEDEDDDDDDEETGDDVVSFYADQAEAERRAAHEAFKDQFRAPEVIEENRRFDAEMALMAADPDMIRENALIAQEAEAKDANQLSYLLEIRLDATDTHALGRIIDVIEYVKDLFPDMKTDIA